MSEETVRPAGDVAPVGGQQTQNGEVGGQHRLGREDTGRLLGTTGADDTQADLNQSVGGGLPGPGLAGIGPMGAQADTEAPNRSGGPGQDNTAGQREIASVPNADIESLGADDATDPGAIDIGPEGLRGQADATDWGGAPGAGKTGSGLNAEDSGGRDSGG
ncbi:MAG TPA: hypothetical protein VFA07_11490 [Chthonomonadaceae bacterium]|nr:hypothetical protein [Chthonomonadaceae bacterium]